MFLILISYIYDKSATGQILPFLNDWEDGLWLNYMCIPTSKR